MASATQPPDRPDPDSIAQRLKQQFGDQIDPTLPLDPEPAPDTDAPSSLFDKLRGAGTRGTRYRLLGEVARGGMGVILKIWDDELRRTLAMKVVLGRGDESKGDTPRVDPKTLGRFLEEAQVTGQLDHPGIVPVHELGLGADGRVYFTMRLVKGEDLRSIFEKVRTGEDGWNQVRALGVLLKVCEAMSYAHSKKVVHRDLKPANVMVGKFGEVYVMDWGLARVLGREDKHDLRIQPQPTTASVVKTERREKREETPDSPLVTMDGDVVGTPSFMPPEQAKGQLDKLGPHSDVYSLGAMLYQLLTGQMPFVPPETRMSQRTILARLVEGPPEPIAKLAPATPPELVAISEKAMAREVSTRYADTTEFATDLRAYLEGRVVVAYETGTWAETRKWVKRNKPLAVSLAAAAVFLVNGIVAATIYALDAKQQATRADEQTKRADGKALEADRLKDEALAQARELKVRGLIQELAQFETLDDSLGLARSQPRPAHEWWLERAHRLVDGWQEDSATGQNWAPGLADVEAALAKLRERALTPSDKERSAIETAFGSHTWHFAESDDQWWHSQLRALVHDFGKLKDRIAVAERSVKPPEAVSKWNEAIEAITSSPKYGGLKITPQLGLLPIGKDPASGLWEFSHLESGEVVSRAADGKIVLDPKMGLVFVLLPGGRVPVEVLEAGREKLQDSELTKLEIAPFFLSKYEMTNEQWDRLDGRRHLKVVSKGSLLPVATISWDDCVAALSRSVAWVGLPTEAQWEYGCRAGTTTPWWTGKDEGSLRDAANICFERGDIGKTALQSIGALRANEFGLDAVHGNVQEWCLDAVDPQEPTNPPDDRFAGGQSGRSRMIRGGARWDAASGVRSSSRGCGGADVFFNETGLRPARALTP